MMSQIDVEAFALQGGDGLAVFVGEGVRKRPAKLHDLLKAEQLVGADKEGGAEQFEHMVLITDHGAEVLTV